MTQHGMESAVTSAAYQYTRNGWRVVPIPHMSKNPGDAFGRGWEQARLTETDLPQYFNGKPGNIGVLLGEPSGWLIDIDLDHPRAVELAPSMLPPTPAVFGRESKKRSHWIYFASAPVATKKWKSKSAGMIVELRSTGGQTVFPPSYHPSGELIAWDDPDAIPATVDPNVLLAAAEAIGEQVRVELGERQQRKPSKARAASSKSPTSAIDRCVRAMLRMNISDQGDGSHRLYAAACRAIEHDLSDADALSAIREYERQQPFPMEWTAEQISKRLDDAAQVAQRGEALRPKSVVSLDDPDQRIVANATTEEFEDEEGETKTRTVPLPIGDIIAHVGKLTDGWPRRVGTSLFVDDKKHGIGWLESTASLFGWLGAESDRVLWFKGVGTVLREELHNEMRRTARQHLAVESLPHEPLMPGHYYTCGSLEPGDGKTFQELLDRFNPATDLDRDLIQAAFMTPLWGGHGGTRPCITVTSDDGRGAGKSKLVEMIGHTFGGTLSFSNNEDIGVVKTRLLSPEALTKRVALADNLKSLKFSWAELEALITAPEITGKRMYVGEASRPNTLTWFATLNGASFSTDMAQRTVFIKISRPSRSATWELDTVRFVRDHQQQLLADLIGHFRRPAVRLARYTRWASWEDAVLARLPDPAGAQRLIEERQGESDVDAEEGVILEDFFAEQLKQLDYDPELDVIHIPNDVAARWYGWATNSTQRTTSVTRMVNQMAREGQLKRLRIDPCRTHGRGLQWVGPQSKSYGGQFLDLRERLASMMQDRRTEQHSESF